MRTEQKKFSFRETKTAQGFIIKLVGKTQTLIVIVHSQKKNGILRKFSNTLQHLLTMKNTSKAFINLSKC